MSSGERIQIQGTVQGVGFRPTVARLAQEMGIGGWVQNGPAGVTLQLAASTASCTIFLDLLRTKLPPIAHIESIQRTPIQIPPEEATHFVIRPSTHGALQTTIPPDAAICPACQQEITDPNNRRFAYAFTSCTHCGPRYSIVQSMPYDRPRTTMTGFPLCHACRTEYENPADRRFHAQPIACPQCGPHLQLQTTLRALFPSDALSGGSPTAPTETSGGSRTAPTETSGGSRTAPTENSGGSRTAPTENSGGSRTAPTDQDDLSGGSRPPTSNDSLLLEAAHRLLAAGGILAIKGLGGYHLCCDATQHDAVLRLRERKARMFKPFALMARDLDVVSAYADLQEPARRLLTHPAAPIVLMRAKPDTDLSAAVAPFQHEIGMMLPNTPLHQLLLAPFDRPLICTSGNHSHEPPCIHDDDARERLGKIADALLFHNRPIAHRIDDSVLWIDNETPRMIRRARGYAPQPLSLPPEFTNAPPILALGGQFKATFCMLRDGKALLSPHLGDLDHYATFAAWKEGLHEITTLFDHSPALIAVDAHPQYTATQHGYTLAEEHNLPIHRIQHHHAHIAACMAEHQRPLHAPPLLGIALDGLGYGPDGELWGGEFLLADYGSFRRIAAFESFPLLGGDLAARQPWRNLYAHLLTQQPLEAWLAQFGSLDPLRLLSHRPHGLLGLMLQRPDLAPLTSSCGRWFDAVAAALDIFPASIEEEAQAAIVLASLASSDPLLSERNPTLYPFAILHDAPDPTRILSPRPMWPTLLADIQNARPKSEIAARFHLSLAHAITTLTDQLRSLYPFDTVALSGGVWQNPLLLQHVRNTLHKQGLSVLLHQHVPTHDGGISLGQAVIAAARLLSATHRMNANRHDL